MSPRPDVGAAIERSARAARRRADRSGSATVRHARRGARSARLANAADHGRGPARSSTATPSPPSACLAVARVTRDAPGALAESAPRALPTPSPDDASRAARAVSVELGRRRRRGAPSLDFLDARTPLRRDAASRRAFRVREIDPPRAPCAELPLEVSRRCVRGAVSPAACFDPHAVARVPDPERARPRQAPARVARQRGDDAEAAAR